MICYVSVKSPLNRHSKALSHAIILFFTDFFTVLQQGVQHPVQIAHKKLAPIGLAHRIAHGVQHLSQNLTFDILNFFSYFEPQNPLIWFLVPKTS